MKRTALAVAIAVAAMVAGAYVVTPQLRLWRLERSLSAAADAKTAAGVTRAILKTNSPRAADVLVRFAREREWCAFDSLHQIALLCDETDGRIHVVCVSPQGPKVSTGDPALDKAVEAAIPETTSQSLSIGEPPHLFNGIHLLSSKRSQADFVLRPEGNDPWGRVRFEFNDGRLVGSGYYDVKDADLDEWRRGRDWPKAW